MICGSGKFDLIVRDPLLRALHQTLAGGNMYLSSTYFIEKRGPAGEKTLARRTLLHLLLHHPALSSASPLHVSCSSICFSTILILHHLLLLQRRRCLLLLLLLLPIWLPHACCSCGSSVLLSSPPALRKTPALRIQPGTMHHCLDGGHLHNNGFPKDRHFHYEYDHTNQRFLCSSTRSVAAVGETVI